MVRTDRPQLAKRVTAFLAVLSASVVLCGCKRSDGTQEEKPSPRELHVGSLEPHQIVGRTGAKLGKLVGFTARVNDVNVVSQSFVLEMNLEGGIVQLPATMLKQEKAPSIPQKGQWVVLSGYETLHQFGLDPTVGEYLSTRHQVLDAAGLVEFDPPGMAGMLGGKPRFDTIFTVVEMKVVSGSKVDSKATAPKTELEVLSQLKKSQKGGG